MLFAQVIVPALLILAVGLWGGARFERIRWESKERQKRQQPINVMRKRIDYKV